MNFEFQRRKFAVDMPGGNNGYYFVKDDFQGGRKSCGGGTGEVLGNKKVVVGEETIAQRGLKAELDLTPKLTPYKSLSRGKQKK